MVDTGSEWCVAAPQAFAGVEPLVRDEDAVLHSRYGLLDGFVTRASVIFIADQGEMLTVDATWFISEDWTGPVVLGWKGCFERMNFAFDTAQELFWFGPQEGP